MENICGMEIDMSNKKVFIRTVITLCVFCLVFAVLQRLLMPKYADDVVEGNLIKEYYSEENKEFDVVFIGDCEVYENFSPVKLWEDYGIHSYIRGSAEQYIWQSYYLLEDTLRFHKPQVVVFNIQSLQFNESASEAYNRMTLDGMQWSVSKVKAINASMKEEEHFIEYVFPLLRYHSRWSELTSSDFKYLFAAPEKVSHNGYYMRVDTKPVTSVPTGRMLSDYSFGENAWKYLDKMRELCEENDIQLLLIKAPSLYPYWYDEYNVQVEEYAQKYQLPYINFLEKTEEIGIDYTTDTYDAGLHMNLSGAEKLSHYLGEILSVQMKVSDRRNDEKLSAIWKEKTADYEKQIEEQCVYYGVTLDRK